MALTPYLLSEVLDDLVNPRSIFDQNFGLGILSDDLVQPRLVISPNVYRRPWRHLLSRQSGASHVLSDKDGFKVNLDVQQFRPEEVSVKVVDDYVVVEGKHEERKDEHGYISRQFQRRYLLPDNIKKEALESRLSSDGVLTLCAPKKEEVPPPENERSIPIIQTGQPALKQQPQQQSEAKGDAAAQKMET